MVLKPSFSAYRTKSFCLPSIPCLDWRWIVANRRHIACFRSWPPNAKVRGCPRIESWDWLHSAKWWFYKWLFLCQQNSCLKIINPSLFKLSKTTVLFTGSRKLYLELELSALILSFRHFSTKTWKMVWMLLPLSNVFWEVG